MLTNMWGRWYCCPISKTGSSIVTSVSIPKSKVLFTA